MEMIAENIDNKKCVDTGLRRLQLLFKAFLQPSPECLLFPQAFSVYWPVVAAVWLATLDVESSTTLLRAAFKVTAFLQSPPESAGEVM